MEKVVDILKLAIENEVGAKSFYARAAEITSDGESQMVFLELVEMEDGHARRLVENFHELMAAEGVDAQAFLEDCEAASAESPGARENDVIARGDMRRVIEFAIEFEARARDSYRELATRVEGTEQKDFCEELAAEEQNHFETLSKLRVSVDTPIDERPAL